MASRLLVLDGKSGRLAARVRSLTEERSILIVSSRRPMHAIRKELEAAGVNLAHVFIVDTVTDELAAVVKDPEHEAFVPNASLLELIASRVRRIIVDKAERPATIIVDDVAGFASVAPVAALVEIASIVRAWTGRKHHIEYIIRPGTLDANTEAHVKATLDEAWSVDDDGRLVPL